MSGLRVALVGTGAVACAVARALVAGAGELVTVLSRSRSRAEAFLDDVGASGASTEPSAAAGSDVVLVAVTDTAVPAVGARLATEPALRSCLVLHTSGVLEGAALGSGLERTGSLHPLRSFASGRTDPADLAGVHWFHEGAGAEVARRLVDALRGRFHVLDPGAKALYHAGAAVLSNHAVALYAMARELFGAAGIGPEEARAPLLGLLAGTVSNLEVLDAPAALTGPVARGDVETVRRHLEALDRAVPARVPAYVELARIAVELACAKGTLDGPRAAELRELLTR